VNEWIQHVFEAREFGILALPAAAILGLLTALGSGCNVALLAAVAGYAGSREDLRHRDVVSMSGCFMLGTVLSLACLGALIAYFGRMAGGRLGRYGEIAAALLIIFFGLAVLKVVPFRLPSFDPMKGRHPRGLVGAGAFGLAVGAASITCTMTCCGPLLPVVLGLAALRGQAGWGAAILTLFAIGYSAPLAAVMLGVGTARLSGIVRTAEGPIRVLAGVALIAVGFWLLTT